METPFAAYTGDQPYVFVCYAHEDSDVVYPEMTWLRDQGVNLWYDEGISAGKNWRTAIGDSLLSASHLLFYVSAGSLQSDHCNREINLALDEGKDVVPVYIEDVELTTDLKVGLNRVQALHRDKDASYQPHLLNALGQSATRVETQSKVVLDASRSRYPARIGAGLALALLIAAGWWFWPRAHEISTPAPAAKRLTSIAVLPFVDMSADGDQEYFGDGIAQELLNELSRLDGLRVAGRTSSFSYKDRDVDITSIAEALNVNAILEGSIRKDGSRIRISVQLIDAADGFQLWSETYDRQLSDIFVVQEEIAASVAGALGVTLGVGGVNAFRGSGTQNVEAYENFLRSLQFSVSGVKDAIRLLERAIRLDPNYAAAWAQSAARTSSTMWLGLPEEAAGILERAYSMAQQAVELDPESGEANTILAGMLAGKTDWIGAEEVHAKALSLRSDRPTLERYGRMLMRAGRGVAARKRFDDAELAEPLGGRSAFYRYYVSISQQQYGDATEFAKWSGSARPNIDLVIALNVGDPVGIKAAIRMLSPTDIATTTLYAPVLEQFDSRETVLSLLRAAYVDTGTRWPSKAYDIALLAAYFGDPEFAVQAISDEVRHNPTRMGGLWFPVMSDARRLTVFKQLVTDINLVQYWRAYGWADACVPLGNDDFACE